MARSESDPTGQPTYNPDRNRGDSAGVSVEELDRLVADHELFQGWALKRVGNTHATHSKATHYQSALQSGHTPIVVKHTSAATPEKAAESVSREFAALETTWRLAGPDLQGTLPKPLLMLPDRGLLVTERLPGVPLSRVLARSINYLMAPFRTTAMGEIARRIGIWLRQFHQATSQPPVLHDPQAFEQEVTQQLEGCIRRGLSAAAAKEILQIASQVNRLMVGQSFTGAARHGDFTPRNILISGDHIGVIDFENFLARDAVYEDLGKFVAFLALLKGRPGYSRTAITSVMNSFLQGYGILEDRRLVDLFALKAALRIFAHRGIGRTAKSLGLDSLYTRQFVGLGIELRKSLGLPA
jgi:tRNA A-37 threonylcarbamoyl transferase component Bud32